MKDRSIEKEEKTAYEIKKIILKDGTNLDIDKITHVALIKDKQKGNHIDYKITYCAKNDNELLSMSNECSMLAHAFKFMREYHIPFDEACIIYDKYIEEKRKELLKNGKQ